MESLPEIIDLTDIVSRYATEAGYACAGAIALMVWWAVTRYALRYLTGQAIIGAIRSRGKNKND